MESKVTLKKKNPHSKANFLSKLLLTWSFDLFRKGYKQGITVEELWQARDNDQSGRLGDQLEQAWQRELDDADRTGSKPSLTKAIVRTFWLQYMLCGLFVGILFIIIWPLIPYTLALFINYFSGEINPETYRNAHIYCLLMNICSITTALMLNHLQLGQGVVGMRVRIACCSLLYRKILKLDRNGMSKTEPGQVINLMSNDVMRFDLVTLFLHYLWVMPIVVPIVSFLVWQHLKWATFAALAVIFVQTVLVQTYLSNRQGVLRGKIAKRTDERVKVMSELVNGVQVIKMYAWEKPFEKLVDNLRKLEVNFIMRTSMIKGFSTALSVFTERFILFSAIVAFVLMGGQIRAEIAFSLVQYFNLLQLAANIFFPLALSCLAEAKVSVRRLEDFLLLEELESPKAVEAKLNIKEATVVVSNGVEKEKERVKPTGLVLAGVSASWAPDPIVDTLRNISFTAQPGEFVGVAGLVGAGKSSLLQVILGELPASRGSVSLGGARVSYASQEPWLFVATVRHNILFGLPYDRVRYKKVVAACALVRDFELLPAGDATLVGERGISLSGGQRARIGLARACYRQADLYLLDDPLSAVDAHVGKHLVAECVNGLLRHHTRVLVTHQLTFLRDVDQIIILKNGTIAAAGSFETLSASGLDFASLLARGEEEERPTTEPAAADLEESPHGSFRIRQMSIHSLSSVDNLTATAPPEGGREEAEMKSAGAVSAQVYGAYLSASGHSLVVTLMVAIAILAQVFGSGSDWWTSYWVNLEEKQPQELMNRIGSNPPATLEAIQNVTQSMLDDVHYENSLISRYECIYIYTGMVVALVVISLLRSFMFFSMAMRASTRLHNKMFSAITRAPMRFFHVNPSGRILNRFSKDMGAVDEVLPAALLDVLQIGLSLTGIVVVVAVVNYWLLLPTLLIGLVFYGLRIFYLASSRSIKRLEGLAARFSLI
ncbi:probable multidrug resistance-associated protein lethal(2)03659 [Choristoneura fumiferana]|uniref:probable multidrug resistance-associated protein lethal(2)03659 n=1 Tax=Choristoneura fumiferana TaxID=7141 RepID=UPI003D1597F9